MNRKYVIYENDLKFRSSRNLDESNIDWTQNDIKHLYNIDHDTLQYRINASVKSGYSDLDLEQMNLIYIPNYFFLNIINFINIKNLFLSNNNLIDKLDLSIFKNLEMVDLDNNKLNKIILPNNIIELSCNNNLLQNIPDLKNAKRCRLSNNKINSFNISSTDIEIIELDNNDITQIDISHYYNLKKFIIYKNPLTHIKILNNNKLKYVDLSETKIINLDNINNIEHLVLNQCDNIKELPKSDYLQTLEIINTPIEKLQFYKEFELIIFQSNLVKNVSSKYKLSNANIQLRKNIYIVISKNSVNYEF